MKKKLWLLVFLMMVEVFAVLIIVPMANYIYTYESWYSFVSLPTAIIILVISVFIALASIIAILVLLLRRRAAPTSRAS